VTLALGFAVLASFAATVGQAATREGRAQLIEHADVGPVGDVSANWAGYVVTGPGSTLTTASPTMSYTDVTGQWTEPKATCGNTETSVALWVGLGGYSINARNLEQAGTSADCSAGGKPSYYAWYELVPANSVNIKLKIFPGDTVASTVLVNGSDVLVQITDRTRGTRFTKHLMMATPDLTSAEWIVEAPAECTSVTACHQLPLTNFDNVTFTRTFAIGNTTPGTITSTSWLTNPIELVPHAERSFGSNGTDNADMAAGATPVGIAPDGSGFTVDWEVNGSSEPPPAMPITAAAAPTAAAA